MTRKQLPARPRVFAGALFALALLVLSAQGVAAGEPVRVRGTGVSLVPPAGFVPAERFSGFQSEDAQASIMVSEIPGPYAEVKQSTDVERLATRGMRRLSAADVTVNGAPGLLVRVEQTHLGTEHGKWILVGGDATGTVMIVGTFPKASSEKFDAPLRAALLSATWTQGGARDPFEGLPFRLAPTAKLRFARRVGNMVGLTESGKMPVESPSEAFLIVGISHSVVATGDLATFAEQRARATESLTAVTRVSGTRMKVADLDAYELVVEAKDAKSGEARHLYQVVALDGTGYWLVQGIVASDRATEFLTEFRAIVATLRKAPPPAPDPKAPPPGK